MTERNENREWLAKESAKWPDGWEAGMIAAYGMNGALDLLAAQGGRPNEVNLTHRPFAGNPELKELVRNARTALHELAHAAYLEWWFESKDGDTL